MTDYTYPGPRTDSRDIELADLAIELAIMLKRDFQDYWAFETNKMVQYAPILDRILADE